MHKFKLLLCMILCNTMVLADTIVPAGVQSAPNMCAIIPSDTMQFVAVFEPTIYNCDAGYYLPKLSENCVPCPENSYCPGGDYTYSESDDTGISTCPNGTLAPSGMWELAQCGRKLHFGDSVLFLRASKQTEHALYFDTNGDGAVDWFANLTTVDTPMNKDTDKKLKIQIGDVVYFAYDDTIKLNE